MFLNTASYRRLVDNLNDGLYIVDRHRIIQYWNKAAERISGFSSAEVIGRSCADNILTHVDCSAKCLCLGTCPLAMTMADGAPRSSEIYLHHKDGHRIPVAVRASTITDENGNVIGAAELFTDISNFRNNELKVKELEELALIDNLTRLANRHYIEKDIAVCFEEKKRIGIPFGILFMDIDHFKIFNDTYGHDTGDRVLTIVADTLVTNARPFDLIGRWGGEEFIGVIRNVTGQQLEDLGNRLRSLVESSYIQAENQRLHVSISIGATLVHDDDSMDSVIKRADTLLYESKRGGRNRLTFG